jgi:TPP-dependent pyruvate/acetoin dehydrogenase alpha subunit
MEKCPVERWKNQLLLAKIATVSELELMSSKIDAEIESAFALAKADPFPSDSELFDSVY